MKNIGSFKKIYQQFLRLKKKYFLLQILLLNKNFSQISICTSDNVLNKINGLHPQIKRN